MTSRTPSLMPCPNCGCGIQPNSMLCDYCLAILVPSESPTGSLQADGITCRSCGERNDLGSNRCAHCLVSLSHTCPGCGKEDIQISSMRCPQCHLARSRFLEKCIEIERRRTATLVTADRRSRLALLVPLAFSLGFVLLGVYQYLSGFGPTGNAFFIVALLFLGLWVWAYRS
jgi:hypothetical protein